MKEKDYEEVLNVLGKLRDIAVMSDTKTEIQSAIVALSLGNKNPALNWLHAEVSRQGQLLAQSRYHKVNWRHKEKRAQALRLIELLAD